MTQKIRKNQNLAGKIGGKVMTDKKKAVLKKNGLNVGKNFGRKGGIKHQHSLTKQRLSSILQWEHEHGIHVITFPQETVGDLVRVLNSYVPGSIKKANCFSELLRGVAKTRYGWRILKEFEFDDETVNQQRSSF